MGISSSKPKPLFICSWPCQDEAEYLLPAHCQKVTEKNPEDTIYFLGKVHSHSNSR